MRHTTILLAAACLALAGCSSGGDSDASSKPTTTTAAPSPTVDKKAQYLEAAHQITFNGTPSDLELAVFPGLWCNELEAGHSVEWMFDITGGGGLYPVGEDWGTAKPDAHELLMAGVEAYCPENLDAVREELRASGEY